MSTSQTDWTWRLEKSIPSSTEEGHAAIEELVHALERDGWEGRDFFHIHMATEEAVVNAIEHGNKRSAEKTVHLDFKVSVDQVRLVITDQGSGFNPDTLPDPTDDDLLDKPRGRGVMLIKELMTEAHYNQLGNSLMMIKRRSPPAVEE